MLRHANYKAIFILRGVVPLPASVVWGLFGGLDLKQSQEGLRENVLPHSSSYPELCLLHPPTQLLGPSWEFTYAGD